MMQTSVNNLQLLFCSDISEAISPLMLCRHWNHMFYNERTSNHQSIRHVFLCVRITCSTMKKNTTRQSGNIQFVVMFVIFPHDLVNCLSGVTPASQGRVFPYCSSCSSLSSFFFLFKLRPPLCSICVCCFYFFLSWPCSSVFMFVLFSLFS